jgi:hypothetical protein
VPVAAAAIPAVAAAVGSVSVTTTSAPAPLADDALASLCQRVLGSARDAREQNERALWQSHLVLPGANLDESARAAGWWRPDAPTGAARTLKAFRQATIARLLKSAKTGGAR